MLVNYTENTQVFSYEIYEIFKNNFILQSISGGCFYLSQVFSCEVCENFKNNYFEEHLRKTASRKT